MFQVLSERHERGSLIITTNLPFGEWTKVFPDARLAKAFNEPGINSTNGGVGGQHYSQKSQYDVACYQVSQTH